MSDMPGGSSYFHGNSDPDITMNGGSTELWQAPHDADDHARRYRALAGAARRQYLRRRRCQARYGNEPRSEFFQGLGRRGEATHQRDLRTNLFQAKRVAVSTPGRNEAVEARIDADAARGKAKAAIREKRELAAQLNTAQQQIMALQMEQQRLSEQRNEEMTRQQNHWKTEWNKFSHEREIVFQRNLERMRQESYQQAQAQMESQIAAREAELKARLAEIEETHQREQDELLREQMRLQRTETGPQQPQQNEMEEVHFPNAPPARIPEYIAEATRQARRLEAVIRQGVDRFPVVTMAAPTQPAASAAPDTPQQSTSHTPMMIDFNDPAIEERLKGMVYGILGKSPRKKRQAKAGATTTLIRARHEQQDQMTPADDLRWKTIVRENWRTTTGLNRARDFCDYEGVGESVMLRCEAGETAPEACTSKLYFGPSWATCLWNKKIVEFFVQQVLEKRKEDTNAYDVPDVSDVYLSALTRTEWSRHQPRLGESVVDARKRVEAFEVDRRTRNIANSRKKNKFDCRVKTAEKMVGISLAKNDTAGAATWKWIEEELLPKLGVAAMSSEEDEPLEVQVGDQRRMTTAHNIKVYPWRINKVTDYVELIDKTTETCQRAPNKRFRLRGDKKSITGPPLKLPRTLYDETWIATTKEFMPDIEEDLEISNEAFELMEITLA
ncbi:hypothetical protein B0H13DRAFT_1890169 [Mycena leptocephala]|nr:hypothetical protein B0H13DRAFT_1890169 [Mycena leptocephala]